MFKKLTSPFRSSRTEMESEPAKDADLLDCSADLRVCCIAGFQTGAVQERPGRSNLRRPADLEIGDTAGLETCATHGDCAHWRFLAPPLQKFDKATYA
jgi:hypothetical protein